MHLIFRIILPYNSTKQSKLKGDAMIGLCDCVTDDKKREIKEHGSFAFPVACYVNHTGSVPVPWHWHDELEVIFVKQGSVLIQIASERQEVTEGNGCFINAGILHAVEKSSAAEMEERSIVFHPRLVGGSMDSVFWQKYVLPVVSDRSLPGIYLEKSVPWQKEILSCIQTAWEVCALEKDDYEIAARNALSRCLSLLLRRQSGQQKKISEKALRQTERMKVMLNFIQQHFDETISIRQIAGSASVSESECMRCFRQTIGITPITYLKNYRLQYAAQLLKSTDLPVSSIGSQCGFQEMSYFSRAFGEIYGYTPSQYRKLC